MNKPQIRVTCLDDCGDMRGSVFHVPGRSLEFLEVTVGFSILTLKPDHFLGNHSHQYMSEVVVILHQDSWSLHWDTGENTQKHERQFNGSGAEIIEIEPLCSHAFRNTGNQDVYYFHIGDKKHDS